MRTIDFSRGWRANLPVIFAVLGLSALWYYQRRGGRIQDLVSRGADGLRSARDVVSRVAPSAATNTTTNTSAGASSGNSPMTSSSPGTTTPGL